MNRHHAVAWCIARSKGGDNSWHDLCQKMARTALNADSVAGYVGYSSAIIDWAHVPKAQRHSSRTPPFGVPCSFDIGNFGHKVIADDTPGFVWSTDILRRGCIDRVSISYIEKHWGARYLGWAESIDAVTVFP